MLHPYPLFVHILQPTCRFQPFVPIIVFFYASFNDRYVLLLSYYLNLLCSNGTAYFTGVFTVSVIVLEKYEYKKE